MKGYRFILIVGLAAQSWAAPAAAPEKASGAPQSTPTAPSVAAKSSDGGEKMPKSGDMGVETIEGKRKQRLDVGKYDPPAAFNLEDIQNFPEDRLVPVLNNPLTFEEGRDFSSMMNFQDDQLYHPWLPELPRAPFLTMRPVLDKPAREWTFSIIDQAGATVSKQQGQGAPPGSLTWNGEDGVRTNVAVDTVYIPQLATKDKEGYHHTYMGQPVQFSAIFYKDKGKTVIELSSKRLFLEKKADLSKEAPVLLDKVCDILRESSLLPFSIQPYDNDTDLARQRQKILVKYFSEKLYIPETQISLANPSLGSKRGSSMAIISNVGGS